MTKLTMEEHYEPVDTEIMEAEKSQNESPQLENGVLVVYHSNHSKVQPPYSVVLATLLYCAEFVSASVLCNMYYKSNDQIWLGFTISFMLVPAILTQLALTFIHRDLGRDRPLVLFMHLLLMGPIVRCFEALIVYFKSGKKEEPYVTISRKIDLAKSQTTPMEWEIGHSERKLAAHRNAFKRTAVIQAFLGSTPQLTLQLYATIQEKTSLPPPPQLIVMIIALVSITYGALVCSVLAIQIRYDDYKVRLRPAAYICMILWRGLEIATRITSLVLFSTALTHWVIPVGLANLLLFFFLPWAEFWARRGSLPENVEKNFGKLDTTLVLCMFIFLYACINIFCWSAVQLDLADRDLIQKKQGWRRLAVYYGGRFVENVALITFWYFFKMDFYEYVCAPMLVAQLLICYSLAVLFMLLFYQFCHPCRQLFRYNVHDCLHCVCCLRCKCCSSQGGEEHGHPHPYATAATMVLVPEEPLNAPLEPQPLDLSRQLEDRETDIVDDVTVVV